MPTPLQFMNQYRNLQIPYVLDNGRQCVPMTATIAVRKYFMMNWTEGTDQHTDYFHVSGGGRRDPWFQQHKDQIRSAAMGKGAPADYQLALEWAVRSGKIANPSQATIQAYCDDRLGIDCSGFATNYLIANGKKANSSSIKNNTGAASYFQPANAVNDSNAVRQGDLLVWMRGNSVMTGPGHVAVVESYRAQCVPGGNMRVCEATGAAGANPKLLDSMYSVTQIIPKEGRVPAMILVVDRHGTSGSRVAVIRL
ncbi:MAG: CHAP domain-containing protein [Planctomycetaceae bacterium]